ncbi:PKD domain-containing protein [Winogradskyella vidalii]|uniref:PKD domain-containing protein n=1 Tax=Winogradskyella vidalii TaxID=2615024 RepID=UPI0015CC4D4E|nr:PKD domain-containing protein [Winogradskyella vidalii]
MGKIKYGLLLLIGSVCGIISAINITDRVFINENISEAKASELALMPPTATISGTTTVCVDSSPLPQIIFTGASGATPYTFTYTLNGGAPQTITTGGANSSINLNVNTNTIGDFTYQLISVTDSSGETVNVNPSATVSVSSPPTVDFTFNNYGCSATPVQFTPIITGNGPYTYQWNFGDGNNASNANPSHIFDAFGCGFSSYTASLTVTDVNGCTTTITKPVEVEQRPDLSFQDLDALFTPPFDNCGNNTVNPEYTINVGNTSPSDSCITSYDIDWGDGNAETNVTFPLTHTYEELGSFSMVITGYGDSGCNAVETILVKNSSNPIGSIISPGNTVNLCLPINELDFQIGSWGANPPDTVYDVNYGDGTTESYTQDDLIAAVSNYDPDNPTAANPFPIPHEYTESSCPNASYTITLVISTSCGETVLTAGPIIILSKPEVDFSFETPGCLNTEIQFNNLTDDGYGPNCIEQMLHTWDFGDGTTSTLENPSHIYTAPGTYTVTLIEENFCGLTDPVVKTICIEPELVPEFTLDVNSGCTPLDVNVTNTTDLTDSCGSVTYDWEVIYTPELCGTSANWSFTNGTNETSADPSFQFIAAGYYELIMTATNSCGDFTTSQSVEVKQPPNVTLNPIADACDALSFNPIATVYTCAPTSETIIYNWSFPGGSPATSNQLDPGVITYATTGDYTVTLNVTNSCGTTTATETFSIDASPTITNTDLSQTVCSGSITSAINFSTDITGTTYSWISNNPTGLTGFVPSGTSNSIPTQVISNTTTSPLTLTYTVTPEVNGCAGAPVNFDIIVEPAPSISQQPQSNAVCQNGTAEALSITFQASGTANYQWYENSIDDTSTGTPIPGETAATYTPPTDTVGTTYYYVVIVFSTGDCNEITSDTAEVEVANTTQIDSQPLTTQALCIGGTAQELSIVTSGGAGVESYQWFSNTTNTNSGGTAISGATDATYTPPVYTTTGTFYYYVEVSYTGSGCAGLSSAVSEIEVVNDPIITSEPIAFQNLCQNTIPTDLSIVTANGLGTTAYQWYVNTVNDTTTGTAIAGATAATFTPPVTAVGTLYYYCVVSQDVSGCEVTSAISEVEISPGAQFDDQPISDELCFGETTPSLMVAFSNGTGIAGYQWYQNSVDDTTTGTAIAGATSDTYSPDVTSVGTTYYYVIITFSSGGCTEIVSDTAEIIVNGTPSIGDATALICSGNTFEFIPEDTPGNVVPVNTLYSWTTPNVSPAGSITGAVEQSTPIATISQFLENTTTNPATVTYTVTPVTGDCIGEDFEVLVTINPSITVASTLVNNLCFESNNASIETTIVGGVPFSTGDPYLITWTGPSGFTSTNTSIYNLEAGAYVLAIADDGGCPYTETFTITEPDELIFDLVDFDPNTISCFGANDGAIGIDIAGGTLPYTYSWTRDGAPFSTDEDLTDLEPGDYTITVTDANNCGPITQNFSIEEPELLVVSLDTKTDVLCYGDNTGAINITVVGGRTDYEFTWAGPNGFSSSSQNLDAIYAGVYNLTVTDNSGCTDTLDVEILQNSQIEIEVTVTEIICYGDNDASITINNVSGGIPPYEVSWSNFGTGNSQVDLSAGTYTITITDAENCARDFPIVIEEAPLFLIDPVVTQMSCSGENDASIVLNFVGGIAPVTVVWDDGSTAGTERHNLAPGTYSVTITDGTPCIIQDSFTIHNILPLELSANVTDALDCDDPNSGAINLLIQGGTPPFDVLWSNGATTDDLDTLPPNTYTANVTDANGCEIEGSWTVNRFETLTLDVETQLEVNCETRTINQTFEAVASGGVPPFQYHWSSGTVSGANNELMTTDIDGLVMLEVVDSMGCTTNYSLNVEAPVIGEADFTTTSFGYLNYGIYAIQDPIEFISSITGNYESVLWDFGDGSFSSEESPFHTYFTPGSYVITQTVTYAHGCVYVKTMTLVVEEGYKLVMPDAFTPNDDGINDFFGPVYIGLNNLELSIYDTWGSLIYKESGDAIRGWDGKVKDEEAENGNYYYTFSAQTFYGNDISKQGAFVFIK